MRSRGLTPPAVAPERFALIVSHPLIAEFERLIRRDPARRGLIGSEAMFGPLGLGELAAAAEHLAGHARQVGIVTGFYIPRGEPPAAETDGPPGTLALAHALRAVGAEATIITDPKCAPALAAALRAADLPAGMLWVADAADAGWLDRFFEKGPGRELTHLIALERVGPSHTLASLRAQPRGGSPAGAQFEQSVPPEHRDRCHNMRGEIIDDWTGPLHRLFEELPRRRPAARSIGIGDGGNEIGMGRFAWEDLTRRLDGPQAARLPCRIATHWTILAGTSNWGGYALAAALLLLRERCDVLGPWTRDHELHLLRQLVEHGPAVDGISRRQEATVDGLPFLTYIQPWEGIRHLLGLP